ncbi:P-loop containing nucleoside triphosphate hydrolase protein [Aureobasidium pullulans]|uniref:p-loop containing nucleoside triphosphate hydrolase protein n=2 Tax=Aureobasidium pullulans TaxID=5580 RepID=A0A074XN93_AURPU|nr:P-loop containing nucleoside triphosphate hydrolase protein [Aureobasidium pullulans EXF-150]THW15199.1 P-loop containing nucleoside triphosphate hydrolase protein [Aureobasidium pullulans]KEQ83477.1 P-loop containing nucleoside triphosphate hydrolase protein [Aureobasidium pullulans EXF-150]THX99374.1 P-loop containing nucleoside triphosphate hydrolase protein [Aureobasidium pullulans]THZ11267.1 P-loop containing nucleoside triphosphate hydrolase protein [Aureobasidium pullulans]TIA46141.1
MSDSQNKAVLVGVSGVSSSGKTTLARLLRDILPNAFILHEDDFYKTDQEIPVNKDGVQDWDCLESLDLEALEKALDFIKTHGQSPPDLESKEDKNAVGESGVDKQRVAELKDQAHKNSGATTEVPIFIIDGFLLFSQEMQHIRDLFDVKLFLRANHKTVKQRREARSGYVTLEGFWEDPPGYVDSVVWANYAKDHAFLFEDGDVEGKLKEELCQRLGIDTAPQAVQSSMTACVDWAYTKISDHLSKRAAK